MLSDSASVDADLIKNVTPQMLLVCCWRTLKEISLFFGDIIQNLPIEEENEPYLLTSKRVILKKYDFKDLN